MKISKRVSKFLKKRIIHLGVIGALAGSLTPTLTAAHDGFFLGITLNPETKQYVGMVTTDSNGNGTTKHAEIKNTDAWFGQKGDGGLTFKANNSKTKPNFSIPGVTASSKDEDIKNSYDAFFPESAPTGTYKETLMFTFPGRHGGTANNEKRDGDSQDRDQAYWVNSNLVEGLNSAISIVYDDAYSNSDNARKRVVEIATKLANTGATVTKRNGGTQISKTFKINNKTYTITDSSGIAAKNRTAFIAASNYIRVSTPSGSSVTVPWSVSKGYGEGQRLESVIANSAYAKLAKEDVDYLTWQHVVMQGTYNSFVKGIEYSGAEKLNEPSYVEKIIADVLSGLQNGIQSLLGLYSLPEMMLNRGSFEVKNWKGIMPEALSEVADYVHMFIQVIAWLLISGAFVKLLTLRNLAAINTRMRIDLKEGFMDLIVAGFALIMFIPLFKTTVILNEGLVQFFGGITENADKFGSAAVTNGGFIAPILLSFVFLFMTIYMNIIYIMRGITIAALYAFAPLFIVSIAYGGKYKQLFSNFIKELISAIFMQSIHAGLLVLYAIAFANGVGNLLYTLVLTASFIPITKMFKSSILGMSDGAGEGMAGMGTAAISGLAVAGAASVKGMSNGGGGGGGAGSNSAAASGMNFKTNKGTKGGGPGGDGQSVQSMAQNDEMTGAGSPSHYSGKTAPLTSGSSGNNAPFKKEQAMQALKTGGKVAGKGLAMGASGLANAGMTLTDASLGTDMMRMSQRNKKRNSGKPNAGGAKNSNESQSNIPSEAFMDKYQVQEGQQGHQATTAHPDGSMSSIYNKAQFESETGINDIFENDNQIIMTSNPDTSSAEHARLTEAAQVFEKGSSDEVREYQEQGLEYVRRTQEGGFAYAVNKKAAGITSMEKNDSHIMFHRKPDADSLMPNFKDKDSIGSKVGQRRYDDTPKTATN